MPLVSLPQLLPQLPPHIHLAGTATGRRGGGEDEQRGGEGEYEEEGAEAGGHVLEERAGR